MPSNVGATASKNPQRCYIALGRPEIGRILRELRDARLDGILVSLQDEEGLVRRRLAERTPPPDDSADQGGP